MHGGTECEYKCGARLEAGERAWRGWHNCVLYTFIVFGDIVGHLDNFHNEGSVAILLDKYLLIIGYLAKCATAEGGSDTQGRRDD